MKNHSVTKAGWNVQPRHPNSIALVGFTLALFFLGTGCETARRASAPAAPTRTEQAAITPAAALERLKAGNARYVAGRPLPRDWAKSRAETAAGQYPYAIILSCVDSRTSSEIIFDLGLGEAFNARVAGNVISEDILGSIEFACEVAGAKLVAVVGHTKCGAVKGACSGVELGNLTGLLAKIKPAEAAVTASGDKGSYLHVDAVAKENVNLVMAQIKTRSPILAQMIRNGKVSVCGGMYDLESGKVTFFE